MPAPRTSTSPQRARALLLVLFTLLGFQLAGWLSRVPSVRDALELTPSALGTVLLVASLGTLAMTLASGYVNARFGGALVMRSAALVQAVGYSAIGLSTVIGSVPLLVLGVTLQGMAFAPVNVTINVESAGVERRLGRSVMPLFHAMFSIGAVLGAGFGAAASHLRVPVTAQLVGVAVLGAVVQLACVRHVVHDTRVDRVVAEAVPSEATTARVKGSGAARAAVTAWTERRTLLLGLVVFAAALSEGSANQWIPLAVVDGFGTLEAVGATILTVFTASMTVVRLAGTRLLDRLGRVVVLRASGLVSFAGLALFVLAPSMPLAVAGVAMWGMGAALAYPVTLAAASDDPVRAAARVSVVTAFASVARLSAPPVIGALGEVVGIREALAVVGAGLVIAVLVAGQARREVPSDADDDVAHLDPTSPAPARLS